MSLEVQQLERLNSFLDQVMAGNAFYQKKLSGIERPFKSLAAFSEAVPFTTKGELAEDQSAHKPYGTNLTFDLKRYNRFHQTSGSTGTPMRWLDTPESWGHCVDNWCKVFEAAGVTQEDRVLFTFSFGPFLGFWTAFDAAVKMGCLSLPAGGLSTLARLRMLEDNQASVVCCTPTYALRLAEEAKKQGISVDSVKVLIVAGEPGGGIPETRRRIEEAWGARLLDHHGMTEIGPASYGLMDHPGILRLIESAFYAEIIDPKTGEAVAMGQPGELVLTTLGRVGMPLLRYRTGDLVRAWTEAPSELANYHLDGGIMGRIDDMILVRGVNIYPSAVEGVIRQVEGIAEFRVHVQSERDMTELEIEIEPTADCSDGQALMARLGEELKARFALRVPVRLAEIGSLPRFEMKAKRWVVG